jgi:hypothetical protein
MKKRIFLAVALGFGLTAAVWSVSAEAKGSRSSGHYYGGGSHTSSHGGYYSGGSGSSHRGGTYRGPYGGYGRHK